MSDFFCATKTSRAISIIRGFLDQFDGVGIQAKAAQYLNSELTRKALFTEAGTTIDQDALGLEAFNSFLATEARLATLSFYSSPSTGLNTPSAAITHMVRRKISGLLGEWDFDRVTADCGFSGGSSTRLPRRSSVPANKFVGNQHVTASGLVVFEEYLRRHPNWEEHMVLQNQAALHFCVVPGSEFFTVEKSADSRRPACKEPEINMFLQKGLGGYFRRKLRNIRFFPDNLATVGWNRGIDINTQEVNAEMAFEASYGDSLSTIDLSAASDSVSMELVYLLFPHEWAEYIAAIRSPLMKGLDGNWYHLHKVSTMGNGFTFELETLIFWAVTSSVCDMLRVSDRRVAVFGDDIICSSEAAPVVCATLQSFGFIPNMKKTHISGPFRESCGKHYINGYDVTPFNVINPLTNASEVCHLINRLRSWGVRTRIDTSKPVKRLLRLYEGYTFPVVPHYMGTKAGLCVDSLTELLTQGKTRYEHQRNGLYLQSMSFQCLTPRVTPRDDISECGRYLEWLYTSTCRNDNDAYRSWLSSIEHDEDPFCEDKIKHQRVTSVRKQWKFVRWWKEGLYFGPLPSCALNHT